LARLGTKAIYITPGSPWENGYCESFGRLLVVEPKLRRRAVHAEKMLYALLIPSSALNVLIVSASCRAGGDGCICRNGAGLS